HSLVPPLAAGVRVAFGDLDTGAEGAGGLDVGVDVPALVVGDLLDGGLPLDHLGVPDHRDGEVTLQVTPLADDRFRVGLVLRAACLRGRRVVAGGLGGLGGEPVDRGQG